MLWEVWLESRTTQDKSDKGTLSQRSAEGISEQLLRDFGHGYTVTGTSWKDSWRPSGPKMNRSLIFKITSLESGVTQSTRENLGPRQRRQQRPNPCPVMGGSAPRPLEQNQPASSPQVTVSLRPSPSPPSRFKFQSWISAASRSGVQPPTTRLSTPAWPPSPFPPRLSDLGRAS